MLEIFQTFAKLSKLFTKHLESKKREFSLEQAKKIFFTFFAFVFFNFFTHLKILREMGVLHLE